MLDLGCGAERHQVEMAERFGLAVRGIDPSQQKLGLARAALRDAATRTPALDGRVSFQLGAAESLHSREAGVDLVW